MSIAKPRPNALSVTSDSPVTSRFLAHVRRATEINRRYFGAAPGPIRIVVCDSPASWKGESKYYFFPFARGLVLRDGTLVVKSRRLARLSDSEYGRLLVHEMNHLFWLRITGGGPAMWSPNWMVEALACDAARGG